MKKIIKKLILSGFTAIMLFGFASNTFAANPPLSVIFTPNPLFSEANFLPLDEASGTVTVTNNGETSQTILTEAINILDNDNFGSLLHLTIKEGATTLFNNSLANFFASGEVPLGAISTGTPRTFDYTISFINSSDNSYQGKTLGFDVCVGFEGGNTHCGGTVIGDEDGGTGGDGDGDGESNGGGNSSGSSSQLIIFNEQALNITNVGASGSATITWNTNLLATSQVVYGLASGSYILNLTPPNFGYPLYTTEDGTKVMNHSMLLTGLILGETYKYRVVSHASPATISSEHQFTVPLLAINNPNNLNNPNNPPNLNNQIGGTNGGVGGSGSSTISGSSDVNSQDDTLPVEEDSIDSNNNLLAANVLLSGFDNILSICSLIALLILIIIYLIWESWLRKKYEKDGLSEREIWDKFYLFFGASSLLAILISIILREYCPLPVFIISFVLSLCIYLYRKLQTK